jgi:DNA helicase HerA-like ATPase
VDEAHNFLGRHIGTEDYQTRLDAFELIAKEGRKYGLNICLASQRPRDITDGVLSQMGTLIVHRLTNDRDRDVVERACGEIDRAASAFVNRRILLRSESAYTFTHEKEELGAVVGMW